MSGDPALDMSPAAIRERRDIEPRPLAWWGMMLAVTVLVTTYGALYFSYVYIRIAMTRWPPEGIAPPALGLATLSAGALLASAAVLWLGLRRSRRGHLGGERLGLAAAVALAGAHVGLLAMDWGRAGFAADVHSYAALFYVLPMIHVSALALAVLMALVHLALSVRTVDIPRRGIGLRAMGAYWYAVALAGTVLLAVVYLTPHLWPVA